MRAILDDSSIAKGQRRKTVPIKPSVELAVGLS